MFLSFSCLFNVFLVAASSRPRLGLVRRGLVAASFVAALFAALLSCPSYSCHVRMMRRIVEGKHPFFMFTFTNRQRIFDELQVDAGGEKPERQQHMHSEQVQTLHSCTRGVAILKNATRTEGATHKKK